MKMDMYECKDATKKTTYIYTTGILTFWVAGWVGLESRASNQKS